MGTSALPGRRGLLAGHRRHINMSFLLVVSILSVMTLPSRVDGAPGLVRCEREEDLDGSACRVDMLPDSALAEMVYERGFDPVGADRMQLVDAVMQLLDYEYATGEDLRETEYIPGDDGYASAYKQTEAEIAAQREQEAAEAAAVADALRRAAEQAQQQARAEEESYLPSCAAQQPQGSTDFDLGDADVASDASSNASPSSTVDGGGYFAEGAASVEGEEEGQSGGTAAGSDDIQAPPGVDDFSGNDAYEGDVDDVVAGGESSDTVVGFMRQLGAEVLRTMRKDLNALVGLLPAPVAKPIREVATVACDTAVKVIGPALKQAERYTRSLRREAAKSAGQLAIRVKEEFAPKAVRGVASLFSKAKQGLSEAISGARNIGQREDEEAGEEDPQYEPL